MQSVPKVDLSTSHWPAQDQLLEGATKLGLVLDNKQIEKLHDYLNLLEHWNKTYNLTAIKGKKQMLVLHLLDSLSVVADVFEQQPKRLIDVGTGAGLPGLIIAIANPKLSVTLLDTNSKKCRFLTHCKHALKLDNVTVKHQRVEHYLPSVLYDGVISRAFSCLHDMLLTCKHLIHNQGFFAAMKGQYPEQEIHNLKANQALKDIVVTRVKSIEVPYLQAQRHLVLLHLQANSSIAKLG